MVCLHMKRCAQIRMEHDDLDLEAGSSGLGQHVLLARWLDRKCESAREAWTGLLGKFRKPKWSRRRKENETRAK